MKLKFNTSLTSLFEFPELELSQITSRKLAAAVASIAFKTDIDTVTVEDLLSYFPARYEDRSNYVPIDKLSPNHEASVELYVRVSGGYRVGRNRSAKAPPLFIFEINAADAERRQKPVVIWWFISGKAAPRIIDFYQKRFSRGVRFVAFGQWEWDSRRGTFALRVNKPDELEILPSSDDPEQDAFVEDLENDASNPSLSMVHNARIVPVYRKLGPFLTKRLREIIYCVLENLDRGSVTDLLPEQTRIERSLAERAEAVATVHFPPPDARFYEYQRFRSPAQRRLIFEEFFWLSFGLALRRSQREHEPKLVRINADPASLKAIRSLAPFQLTNAQLRVSDTIIKEMAGDRPMNRLLQGDVGSGKTIVAFMAMYAAILSGFQTVLMAPTEILAEQHARNAARLFGAIGVRTELLTGSVRAARKREIREKLENGEIHALIGTHAVIQDGVGFANLGLVVIDEQHRFGVMQRAELRSRGLNPDVLVMTATPIPRSLAMTVYGDLDVSVIDELPPGRTPVKTVVVGEDQRAGVYRGIERELRLGHQVYVVYPLVQESEKSDLKAATQMYDHLREKDFRSFSVGLLHGKMKAAEKEAAMAAFVAGETDILVSTTVIEVGVDVPNASLMIIEHAERFGLSQLHQLRGRVGRGADQSYCVLLTDDKQTADAKERLGIMEETSDGFKIAEKDLAIRGQGEILGVRQAGVQTFRIADIIRDVSILEEAKREADRWADASNQTAEARELQRIVSDDPRFRLGGVG